MTAFTIVLTTSLILVTPGAEPYLGFDVDLQMLFLVIFLAYAVYALTRE